MSSIIKPNLSFVLPCFNEQENIKVSFDEISKKTSELISRGLIFEKNNFIFYFK